MGETLDGGKKREREKQRKRKTEQVPIVSARKPSEFNRKQNDLTIDPWRETGKRP